MKYQNKCNLSGKYAIVLGGAGLLGKEITVALAESGASVLILDINQLQAENIINKVTEIIEKNKREHGVESSAEVEGEDNTECILNLLICACCCIMSLIILWKFAL